MIGMLEEQHKSERAEMVSNVSAAKRKDERQAAAIEQLTRQNSGMEQMLCMCVGPIGFACGHCVYDSCTPFLTPHPPPHHTHTHTTTLTPVETRQELEREKQARVALQAQLAAAQQDAKRQAIQELLASNDLDDSTAAKLEARLEVEELRYHCEILQEELFHARSNLEALSWSAHDLFVEHAVEVEDKKSRKAAAKAERAASKAAAKAAAANDKGDKGDSKPVGKVLLGLARTTSLPLSRGTSPKAPRSGNTSPKAPKSGNASPKAPRGGNASPKAPKSGNASPMAPHSGNASPKAPKSGNTSPKAPRSINASPKAPRDASGDVMHSSTWNQV